MREQPDGFRLHGWDVRIWISALVCAMSLTVFLASEAQASPSQTYAGITSELDLQSNPEILPEDEDWRSRVGVVSGQRNDPGWIRLVPWGLVVWIVIWAVAAGLLALIIFLIWRYGAAIQVGMRATADEGRTEVGGRAEASVLSAEPKALSLDEVLAMDDAGRALGALQRLVLEAALAAMNSSLRKSETARAVLRRLPRDWPFYATVAALVRRAERVRFAGDAFDREGLESIAESVRPVLGDARRAG